jgi:hypothetical protein
VKDYITILDDLVLSPDVSKDILYLKKAIENDEEVDAAISQRLVNSAVTGDIEALAFVLAIIVKNTRGDE